MKNRITDREIARIRPGHYAKIDGEWKRIDEVIFKENGYLGRHPTAYICGREPLGSWNHTVFPGWARKAIRFTPPPGGRCDA